MKPLVKLGIGAVLLGVGFVVSMQAQRELIAKWAEPCEDCDDEPIVDQVVNAVKKADESVKSFIDEELTRDDG